MFAQHPEMAKRFAKHTPDIKALPERKGKGKRVPPPKKKQKAKKKVPPKKPG